MSKIVEVGEDQVWVQSRSGKERAFDRRDVLYPDPMVGDEVVVFKDQDGYPVVQLREYYEEDHPENVELQTASAEPYVDHSRESGGLKKQKKGSAFSENKFGILSIIAALIGLFSIIGAIIGFILSLLGIAKDKKRVYSIIGIVLSLLMVLYGIGSRQSGTDSSQIAGSEVSSGVTGTNRDDWTDPEFGGAQIFGKMFYFDVTNWDKDDSDQDVIRYYPYGEEDKTGILGVQKSINSEGSADAAIEAIMSEFRNDDDYTVESQNTVTINDNEYTHVMVKSGSVETTAYVYADVGYVYIVSGFENPAISPNMDAAVKAFLDDVTFDPAGNVPVYADDNVDISYKAANAEGLYFIVENHTDSALTIQADSLDVNGTDASNVSMNAEIPAQGSSDAFVNCSVPDIRETSVISGQFSISSTDGSLESYKAAFLAVPVLGGVPSTAMYGPDNQDVAQFSSSHSASDTTSSSQNEQTTESSSSAGDSSSMSEEDYKASCETADYESILRNPDQYNGHQVKVSGTIDQIIEGWFDYNTIYVEDGSGNKWDVSYKYADGESHVLEGDYVTVYGECTGTSHSTTVLGKQVTMPSIDGKYIEH